MNGRAVLAIVLLASLMSSRIQAQLAITEVMSLASWEESPSGATNNRPDFWELKNFGTATLSLDGYFFADKRRKDKLEGAVFKNLSIGGGQCIVFFRVESTPIGRSSITNEAMFRTWWGPTKIPSNTVFRTYTSPGLNGSYGDELWLYNSATNPVDWVFMGEAKQGSSFVSEKDSGYFGVRSLAGKEGAWEAVVGLDAGSPGVAAGPFPLVIQEFPQPQTVDAGNDVTFTVRATGLPRPKYQWLWNGQVIPGATSNSYTHWDIQMEHAGQFSVIVSNGLEALTTPAAALTVQINPGPPVLAQAPSDLTVFPGQTAIFTSRGRGYPGFAYQWQSNGVDILGATERTLVLPNVTNSMSGTFYTLRVWNAYGGTNATARLVVAPRPKLRVTEVLGNPGGGDSSTHYNWFELSNAGTSTVDLTGYRFADSLSFEGAWTISTPLSIQAGESIVFVESMSAASFWKWWGPENDLGIQVYTWGGFGLGQIQGDIYFWNAAANERVDWITWASWAGNNAPEAPGVSVECLDMTEPGDLGVSVMCFMDSVNGENGAYHSARNGDLGSPGLTANPRSRIVALTNGVDGVKLKCRVVPNRNYYLKATSAIRALTAWDYSGPYSSTNYLLFVTDAAGSTSGMRYYMLEEGE
jgi:hypothetical protein